MSLTIDYFLAPQSPWTYFGHARLTAMAAQAGATLRIKPMDLGGQVFPVTGGLPVGQRSPQRQAYRLVELRRFADHLKLPLNLHPRFFRAPDHCRRPARGLRCSHAFVRCSVVGGLG